MVSSPSMPAAPDPVATANAQGTVNRETAITNATMSHVNQSNPWGTQTWSYDTSTPGGKAWSDYANAYADWSAKKAAGGTAVPAQPQTAAPATDSGTNWEGPFAPQQPKPATSPVLAGGGDIGAAPTAPTLDPQWRLDTKLSDAQQQMLDTTNRIGNNALNIGEKQLGRVGESLSSPLSADGLPDRIMSLSPAGAIATSIGNTAGGIKYDPGYSGAQDLMGQAGGIQKSLDLSGLTTLPGVNDFSADRQKVEDALYGRTTSRLDPQWQQQQNDLAVRLANQGVTTGSEAWQREMDAFNRAKNDAYSGARNDAILAGGTEQSRLFGNALAARQQGYNEALGSGNFVNSAQNQAFGQMTTDRNRYTNEMDRLLSANNSAQAQDFQQQAARAAFQNAAQQQQYQQNLQGATFANNARDASLNERSTLRMAPLNELRGLMGMGTVQAPTFGQVATPQMAAPDLMGATYNSYNGQLQAANAAAANSASMFNGIMGLAGSIGGAALMSDRRVKRDIRRIGTADNGLPLYSYSYIWGGPVQVGVMAQDVEKINPAAVVDVGGIKAVDYGRAFAGA